MKKFLTLILVLTVFTGIAKAQVQVSIGPGVGFNYATHSFSDDDKTYDNFGPLLTSQLDMQFSRLFAFLVWVDFYSDMSAKDDTGELNINYFHIAPTLKFCLPGSRFYLFGGPGIGIKTKGTAKGFYEGFSLEGDIEDMDTRFDVRFGAGYEFYLTNKLTLSPFVAYNAGLNDVVADSGWKIDALQFGVVLRYNLY